MARGWLGAFLGISLGLSAALSSPAERQQIPSSVPATADYLCPSRLQLRHPGSCPDQGPASRLTDLAIQGLYPQLPLPTIPVDPNLGYVPFDYLKVEDGSIRLYASPEDAVGGGAGNGTVEEGFVYLSYWEAVDTGSGVAYSTPGGFVREDGVSQVTPSPFHGLAFSRTPGRPFGWINSGGTCSERTPGPPQDFTGQCYMLHAVVQIYDVQHVGEWDWYMVGPEAWVEQRSVAMVDPDPTPPQGVQGDRWVSVNLFEQTAAAYESGRLVYATAVSTGRGGFWTRPGLFQVWAKLPRDTMTGGLPGESFYYLEDVPWVLYFDQARSLHGTYWHNRFGTPTSHGCVNMSIADARWFYDWASEDTWVYVWDPSGNTPTDPAVYGPGAY